MKQIVCLYASCVKHIIVLTMQKQQAISLLSGRKRTGAQGRHEMNLTHSQCQELLKKIEARMAFWERESSVFGDKESNTVYLEVSMIYQDLWQEALKNKVEQ